MKKRDGMTPYQIAKSNLSPHQKAVAEAGGTLIHTPRFKPLSMPNGGCGSPTHVEGTNGGMMPCGAILKQLDGTKAPYYCALCKPGQL